MSKHAAIMTILLLAGTGVSGGEASAPYRNSAVNAKLNVTVKPDTDVVHFVRDNADPDVVTKTYVLKHADPYEIRRYLREIVHSKRVDESDTGIQAIKYNDGTGIVMVSAEDYRFEDTENGQGIDSIIAMLDKPKVASVTGQPVYVYNPKYRSAKELRAMVKTAGADVSEDVTENIGGSDRIRCDEGLNLMVLKTTQFSRKNIDSVLKEYDRPYPEINAKITVYEIYAENDTKLGLDFQAWKNNDGIDLFNGGARFMQNYAPDASSLVQGAGWSDTKFLNFNPKWNTKYVDFLTSKGKAKVLHTCEMTLRNNTTGEIDRTTQVFLAKTEPVESKVYKESYIHIVDEVPGTDFALNAHTTQGKAVTISAADTVNLTILKMAAPSGSLAEKYVMEIQNGEFQIDGKKAGHKIDAGFAEVVDLSDPAQPVMEFVSNDVPAQKGNKINTESSDTFGFRMSITPDISEKATILSVKISNSSLIGYKSSGDARIQQGTNVESDFMISNSGTKLVIGGLEKRDVVRVSGGIPLLKDLPLLGWIFSTESESTKKSQLLVVAEVKPVRMSEKLAAVRAREIDKTEKKLQKAGESNTFGYRQILLDPERLKK